MRVERRHFGREGGQKRGPGRGLRDGERNGRGEIGLTIWKGGGGGEGERWGEEDRKLSGREGEG